MLERRDAEILAGVVAARKEVLEVPAQLGRDLGDGLVLLPRVERPPEVEIVQRVETLEFNFTG